MKVWNWLSFYLAGQTRKACTLISSNAEPCTCMSEQIRRGIMDVSLCYWLVGQNRTRLSDGGCVLFAGVPQGVWMLQGLWWIQKAGFDVGPTSTASRTATIAFTGEGLGRSYDSKRWKPISVPEIVVCMCSSACSNRCKQRTVAEAPLTAPSTSRDCLRDWFDFQGVRIWLPVTLLGCRKCYCS